MIMRRKVLLGNERVIIIEWHDMAVDDNIFGNATSVANAMILGAIEDRCEECGMTQLRQLDFSQLATATTSIEARHVTKRKGRLNNAFNQGNEIGMRVKPSKFNF